MIIPGILDSATPGNQPTALEHVDSGLHAFLRPGYVLIVKSPFRLDLIIENGRAHQKLQRRFEGEPDDNHLFLRL